ncbi:MAG: alpha/beta hydrolase [Bacteroidales bacterium]|nr:alpha/beta hydrolase [Bacteroidales bacterium]
MWSTGVVEALSQQYKVIVFDYRGMGYSTNNDTSFSISTLADDAAALLDALQIDKAHVLGWSMGGYVAQMMAVRHPEKVSKLILYATNCGDTLTVNPSQEIVDILSNPSSTPMQFLSTLFPDDWMTAHTEPWNFLPEGKEPENGEAIGMQYGAIQQWLSPDGGSAGHLQQLSMPVLLICGSDDKVVPAINSTILSDSIPTATLISVAGTGHGLMYQQPEVFASYLLSFLTP